MTRFKRKHEDTVDWSTQPNEVLFEIVTIGNAVKVSAIEPLTNTEVSIVGSPSMTPYSLKMNALRKLEKVMRARTAQPDQPRGPTRRRGLYA